MSTLDTAVRQDSYDLLKDGDAGPLRLNRRGELIPADQYQQWVAEGRCFIASQTVMETADLIGNDSYVNTVGALAIDVPSGFSMIPLEIVMNQGGTVAGGDITVMMTVDDKVRVTSGVACNTRNMTISDTWLRGNMCPAYSHKEGTTILVVSANAEDNSFYTRMLNQDIVAGDSQNIFWSARKYPAPEVKGPGSMVIYAITAAGAAPSFFWHMIWAEFLTSERNP